MNPPGWQDGDGLRLKWTITGIAGQNSTHGIVNVMVSVPEPPAFALAGLRPRMMFQCTCKKPLCQRDAICWCRPIRRSWLEALHDQRGSLR